ncbi:MAG: helix-turn-helix domain-containing protein [Eubacterium sp.]|nr:helix-turn-helix domain-containing protein [Eubacterium sp.]
MNARLVYFRISEQMSMKKMAESLGVSESYYQKIEYGVRNPSFNFLRKFKSVFPDTDADYLFLDPVCEGAPLRKAIAE